MRVPTQLLFRDLADGREELEAVQVDGDPDRAVGDRTDVHVPELGTATLLQMAEAMKPRGYELRGVDLRDTRFRPLPEGENDELTDRVLELFSEGGADRALGLLAGIETLLIIGIEMKTPDKEFVSVMRNGAVFGPEWYDPTTLVADLSSAWSEVEGG